VEATNAEDQEFGADNLLDAVSSDDSCALEVSIQSVVECLKQFCGHDRLEDDICLLGFKLDP
jgi:serine phosphatase RsbU (regulator of sigma subunit)